MTENKPMDMDTLSHLCDTMKYFVDNLNSYMDKLSKLMKDESERIDELILAFDKVEIII